MTQYILRVTSNRQKAFEYGTIFVTVKQMKMQQICTLANKNRLPEGTSLSSPIGNTFDC